MHPSTTPPEGLPPLDAESAAHRARMMTHLHAQLAGRPDPFMPLEHWMDQVLYAPGLGYYAAGNTKFGSGLPEGDFTTAPELSPVFGATLARQVHQILTQTASLDILEFGAGTGALAAALLPELNRLGIRARYHILEVSADLRERQARRLAALNLPVRWLDTLPQAFCGCVLANEVLDAMPATVFQWGSDGILHEVGVRPAIGPDAAPDFELATRTAPEELQHLVAQRVPPFPGYQSELNLRAEAWVRAMGTWLTRGAALLIDYGFPQREYYHPQRAEGTLMCHFRHHAHAGPLVHPGLQDITTHVDFTAMADAALAGGLDVLGYTSQARFLMNAGIADHLAGADPRTLSAVQKLLSEAEMGELFKVLAVGRGVEPPLLGFTRGDRRDAL